MVLVTLLLVTVESNNNAPVVTPIATAFRHSPENTTNGFIPGYTLGGICSIGNWWVVTAIHECRELLGSHTPPRLPQRPSLVALIALNIRSGLVKQLSYQNHPHVIEPLIDDFFRLHNGVCGVVVKEQGRMVLWEWHLESSRVREVGGWEHSLQEVASVLNLSRTSICWSRKQNMLWDNDVLIIDECNSVQTCFHIAPADSLAKDRLPWIDEGQYFAPASGAGFIVCEFAKPVWLDDHYVSQGAKIACIDPDVPSGVRWQLKDKDIAKRLSSFPLRLAPVNGMLPPINELPIIVECEGQRSGVMPIYLCMLDVANGQLSEVATLENWPIVTPVTSAESLILVFAEQLGTDAFWNLFDCKKKEWMKPLDMRTEPELVPFAIVDEWQILASDYEAIWSVDARGMVPPRRLFLLPGNR